MTVLEKIKRCVSLVWDFQEIYGEEDIEKFCRNELSTYPQHDEIMEYFKHIEEVEKENAELRRNEFNARSCLELQQSQDKAIVNYMGEQLTNAKEIIKLLLWDLRNRSYEPVKDIERAEQFLKNDGCPDVMCEDCTKEDCGIKKLGLVEVKK